MNFNLCRQFVLKCIPLFVFLVLSFYIYNNVDKISPIIKISFFSFASFFAFVFLSSIARACINYLIYRIFKINIAFFECHGLAVLNTIANKLPLSAGLFAKGVYLRQQHRLSLQHYFSATAALYICFISVNGFIGLVTILFLSFTKSVHAPWILVSGFIIFILFIGALWIPLDARFLPQTWSDRLIKIQEGWGILGKHPKVLLQIAGLQATSLFFIAGRLFIAFSVLSQDVLFSYCILFAAASILTRLVTIAPGGIGVREGIIGGLSSLFGFDFGITVVAVMIDRVASTTILLFLGAIYSIGMRKNLLMKNKSSYHV
jgi:uncharacterized membrane protein YbhN (UPF0104 family)